ncbi:MAG: transporter substrate-binding protein [Rhodoferax sp.]|nr:transporter substrate-binding protein [Rhodoferax sp.]
MTNQINRRAVLQAGASATALSAVPTAFAQPAFDWKRYSGQTLEVHLIKSPRGDLLQKHQKEFEDMTGIKVGAEQVPEQQSRQKTVIEFNSGKTSFDVVHLSYHVQKRQFAKGKWMEDLRTLIASGAPADFDVKDYSAGGMFYATQADGRIDSLPLNLDPWILYWNKDLFAAKGVEYPKSFADIVAAAKKLHDPANGVVGFVGRGLKNANVPLWTGFFLGYGGQFFDASGKLATETPEAVASATMYRDLLKNSGPAGVAGYNWNESQSLFLQGKAAMWIDGSGFAPPLEDATKSKVKGKVGYGVMPPGPKMQVSATFGDGIGVSSYSTKKGAAWYYIMWATSKAMQARMLATGSGAPVRLSAYSNAEAIAALTVPPEWLTAVAGSLKIARPGLPIIEPVTEFRDTFGIALNNMLTGGDPAAELKKATAEFAPVAAKADA